MPDTQELEAGTPLAQWWRVGQAITYRGVTGAVERAIGHDLLIRDGEGQLWRIRHDNGEIQRVTIDQPTPTDLSQARIAELLKALTQGPIGDAILGLARGEMQIVAHRIGPGSSYLVSIEAAKDLGEIIPEHVVSTEPPEWRGLQEAMKRYKPKAP